MTIKIANVGVLAMADALAARVNAGAGPGKVRIYSGAVPAAADAALGAAVLLADLTMSDPAFAAATDANPGALLTANAIGDDTDADATGTASFFRSLDSDNTPVFQGTCSASGGGGDMILNSTAIQADAAVEIESLTVLIPEE